MICWHLEAVERLKVANPDFCTFGPLFLHYSTKSVMLWVRANLRPLCFLGTPHICWAIWSRICSNLKQNQDIHSLSAFAHQFEWPAEREAWLSIPGLDGPTCSSSTIDIPWFEGNYFEFFWGYRENAVTSTDVRSKGNIMHWIRHEADSIHLQPTTIFIAVFIYHNLFCNYGRCVITTNGKHRRLRAGI